MMINVQKMVKDMKKMAEEANTTITKIEGLILTASVNNKNNECHKHFPNIGESLIHGAK